MRQTQKSILSACLLTAITLCCWEKGFGNSSRVNIKGLIKFIQKTIAEKYGLEPASCVVTETHFFRGRYKAHDAKKLNLLLEDRKFEDRLIDNDVVLHYKHVSTCRTELPTRRVSMSGSPWKHLNWPRTVILTLSS